MFNLETDPVRQRIYVSPDRIDFVCCQSLIAYHWNGDRFLVKWFLFAVSLHTVPPKISLLLPSVPDTAAYIRPPFQSDNFPRQIFPGRIDRYTGTSGRRRHRDGLPHAPHNTATFSPVRFDFPRLSDQWQEDRGPARRSDILPAGLADRRPRFKGGKKSCSVFQFSVGISAPAVPGREWVSGRTEILVHGFPEFVETGNFSWS